MEYQLTYAGVPFTLDDGKVVRMGFPHPEMTSDKNSLPPEKYQPEEKLLDEIERKWAYQYLQDFISTNINPGKDLSTFPLESMLPNAPNPDLKIGDWYYPNNMSRFSVFRALATSSMVAEMLAVTQGYSSAPFTIACIPSGPFVTTPTIWGNTSNMYMLPARCIAEQGYGRDGLYLVTLVDERYFALSTPASLRVDQNTTWLQLITQLATTLNISITLPSSIEEVYGQPEPDSQLFTSSNSAAYLLDQVCWNVGRTVVRNMDGTYVLYKYSESAEVALSNRNSPFVKFLVRMAGGDIFNTDLGLKIGNLELQKNMVIPQNITYSFPKYVYQDSPVPHFMNDRYKNQRPSSWHEDSYGSEFTVTVPISSGGPTVSGLTGTNTDFVKTTAKAWMASEESLFPDNVDNLTALSLQLARDYYDSQAIAAFDEVYPGIGKWTPEGLHDIIWSYSARRRLTSTRVVRTAWNKNFWSTQHASIPPTGYTDTPPGVGGHTVALTVRDSQDHLVFTGFSGDVTPSQLVILGTDPKYFPFDERWKGQIDNEKILFEGTSGLGYLSMVQRGIDGTIPDFHYVSSGTTVSRIIPDTNYGTNLITFERGEFVFPGTQTSGGISEIVKVPQVQTVEVTSWNSGDTYADGKILYYDPQTDDFDDGDTILIRERNDSPLEVGKLYEGQFAGYEDKAVYLAGDEIGSLSTCGGTYIEETDPRCESGRLNIYKRDVRLYFQSGCLQRGNENWYFSRNEGCCACSGFGSATSGAASGCVPGTCGYCTDPPASWTVPVTGFQGACEVWNRTWLLQYQQTCTWSSSYFANGLLVTCTLVTGATTGILTFTYGPDITQVYTVPLDGTMNCCTPLKFSLEGDCICVNSPDVGSPCPNCKDQTPKTYAFSFIGFTGSMSLFNLTGNMTQQTPNVCDWKYDTDTVSFIFTIFGDRAELQLSNRAIPMKVNYSIALSGPMDCCSTLSMSLESVLPDTLDPNNAPVRLTITPSCSTQGPGICPDFINADPACCSGGGGGGSSGTIATACCPGILLPTLLYANIAGGGGVTGTYGLFNVTATEWGYTGLFGTCPETVGVTISITCTSLELDTWQFNFNPAPSITYPAFVSCDPFTLVFDHVDFSLCGGGADATVTVTE